VTDQIIADLRADAIAHDGVSIYEALAGPDSPYYYSPEQLEVRLNAQLMGVTSLSGLPVKSRSKVAKQLVALALGYEPPASFARTQPRFPHANLDVYAQQSDNLQVWNSEVDAARRYVVLGLDAYGTIRRVRVIAGADLAKFDSTGTLTQKYQASRIVAAGSRLVNWRDTEHFISEFDPVSDTRYVRDVSPVARPYPGQVLTIEAAYEALSSLVGQTFRDPGITQERLRGEVIHRAACEALGLAGYADHGKFPDILSQAIEVKLQLARTVDLGLELPDSDTPVASLDSRLSAQDVRYAVFYADRLGAAQFTITALVLASGASFFEEFQQTRGRVLNSKLQLRLPSNFYSES
jgi:hypothetical protein